METLSSKCHSSGNFLKEWLTVVLVLLASSIVPAQTPWLHVDGNQIKDDTDQQTIIVDAVRFSMDGQPDIIRDSEEEPSVDSITHDSLVYMADNNLITCTGINSSNGDTELENQKGPETGRRDVPDPDDLVPGKNRIISR